MKTIIGAIALVIAAPAAAQATASPDAHAGHGQHGEHGQTEDAAQEQGHEGQAEHKMDCCKDCCDEQEGKKVCCPAHQESGEAEQDHSAHDH